MSKYISNVFFVPTALVKEGYIKEFSHCELAVFLAIYADIGYQSICFNPAEVASNVGFSIDEATKALNKMCEIGLISHSKASGYVYETASLAETKTAEQKLEKRSLSGFIYIVSNESMGNVLKIGMTTRTINQRLTELNRSTTILSPFVLEAAYFTEDVCLVEKNIHEKLKHCRVRSNREFFDVSINAAEFTVMDSVINGYKLGDSQ